MKPDQIQAAAARTKPARLKLASPFGVLLSFVMVLLGLAPAFAQNPTLPNRVLELDGKESYVELPANILNDLTAATVEVWVKCSTNSSGPRFFSYGQLLHDMGLEAYVRGTEDNLGFGPGTLRFFLQDAEAGFRGLQAGSLVREGEWFHVAAVSGPQGMKLYQNGVLVAEREFRGSFAGIKNGARFRIGGSVVDSERAFAGQLDEVRVWQTARAEEQIRQTMFQRLTGQEPGLVGLWNLDDGSARDATPFQHHGKFMGQARTVAANLPAPGDIRPLAVFFGEVRDQAGKPTAGVQVRLDLPNGQATTTQTDTNGFYRLVTQPAAGPSELWAVSGDTDDHREGIELRAGEQRFDFRLKPALTVSGRVLALDDSAQEAVVVQLFAAGETNVLKCTLSDQAGAYKFTQLKPGTYRVRCYGGNHYVTHTNVIELTQPVAGVDFRLAPFRKGTWRTYNKADGLAGFSAFCAFPASDGAVWFGTDGGASRYDGREFVNVTRKDGLADNLVTAIFEDSSGLLWFGTSKGISRYDPRAAGGRVTNFDLPADLRSGESIKTILQTREGRLWASAPTGLFYLEGEQLKRYPVPTNMKGPEEMTVAPDDGTVWLSTRVSGLWHFDGTSFKQISLEELAQPEIGRAHV